MLDPNVDEAVLAAALRECLGLRVGPTVTGKALRTGHRPAFDGNEPSTWAHNAPHLSQTGFEISPVVHRRDRPHDQRRTIGHGKCLGRALDVAHRDAASR